MQSTCTYFNLVMMSKITSELEKERLLSCINRFDQYYSNINNKGNVFLGIGTFIIGVIITCYPIFKDKIICLVPGQMLITSILVLDLTSIIIVVLASIPYLSRKHFSVYYFESISDLKYEEFIDVSKSFSVDDEIIDLRYQVHQLAHGLTVKHRKLKFASILFICVISLFFLLLFFVMLNLK